MIRDFVGFALLRSVIGRGNSHHSLNQSDSKLKTNHNLVACVFPRFRPLGCFNFEFSLVLKGIFLSSDWAVVITLVFFLRHSVEKCFNGKRKTKIYVFLSFKVIDGLRECFA